MNCENAGINTSTITTDSLFQPIHIAPHFITKNQQDIELHECSEAIISRTLNKQLIDTHQRNIRYKYH